LAARIILDLGALHGRIDRDRDGAGIEHGEEGREKLEARGQHERHPISGHDVALNQPQCERTRSICELSVAQGSKNGGVVLQHGEVKAVRMLGNMPLQNLNQRARLGRGRHLAETRCSRASDYGRPGLPGLLQGLPEVVDRIGIAHQLDG
jgi:hypothetical protein